MSGLSVVIFWFTYLQSPVFSWIEVVKTNVIGINVVHCIKISTKLNGFLEKTNF